MKFSIDRHQLIDALNRMQGVLPSRTTLPILSNLLVVAADDHITISANDLDRVIRVSTGAGVDKSGSTTVPGKRLLGIIREMQGGDVMWYTDAKQVTSLECGPSHFKLKGLTADEFPREKEPTIDTELTIPCAGLAGALRQTEFAQSSDETRYILNGVLLTQDESGVVSSVGTDGRRMAIATFPVDKWGGDLVIPGKAIPEIQKVLVDQETVHVAIGGGMISFEGDGYFSTRLIEGNYPNWKQVLPAVDKDWYSIPVEREHFLTVVKRISTMMSEKLLSINFTFADNAIRVQCSAPDLGEAEEAIDVKYTGPEISVSFNPHFILDALRAIAADEIVIQITDESSPLLIKVEGQSWKYVLMPIRRGS